MGNGSEPWRIPDIAELPDLAAGFRRGYKAARHRPDDFHEWRKAVKRHWHHCEALGLDDRARLVHELSDLLGDDHDLATLSEAADRHSATLTADERAQLDALIADHRAQLQKKALRSARKLYATKPRKLAKTVS